MSYSDKVAVFATIPVTVDFVMSGLVADGAVMHLQLLFRESGDGRGSLFNRITWVFAEIEDGFSFWVELVVGACFTVIVGFTMGVRDLFMEENLADGVQERAGFCFHWVCFGRRASGKRMW